MIFCDAVNQDCSFCLPLTIVNTKQSSLYAVGHGWDRVGFGRVASCAVRDKSSPVGSKCPKLIDHMS